MMSQKPKMTVIGAGFVGATTAQRLVEKEMADVVLLDVVEGLSQGKALDMMESASIEGFRTKIVGTNAYQDTAHSEIIIVTAGLARKPGMSRDDLLLKNAEIVSGIVTECVKLSPGCILLMVTNPLDVMTYLAWKKSGLKPNRVLGMAGALDSARYAYFVSEALGCAPSDVDAMVLGGHGDQMVPVPAHTKVQGKPITKLLPADQIEAINQRTRDGGAEVVKLLKTGSAFYAPSSSVVRMVRSILEDRNEVIPACVYLTGQYGIQDIFCGVPVQLGRQGVTEILELDLSKEEKKALQVSAEKVRESCLKLSV